MPITRRQFVLGSVVSFGAATLPPWFVKQTLAATPKSAASFNFTTAFAQLGRLGYGPSLTECSALMQQGLSAYLDAQLQPNDAADSVCNAKLASATLHIEYKAAEKAAKKKDQKDTAEKPAETGLLSKIFSRDDAADSDMQSYGALSEDRPLSALNKSVEQLWPLADNDHYIDNKERRRPAEEVRAATWIRAVHSQWQLRELMVEFWHNHFNVNAFSDFKISATFPLYDAVMRRNCFGNFRTMIEEVAQSPAMLYYLNNAKSRASPANENYARELFELHTLGADHYYNNIYNRWREVPGATEGRPIGYIDQDVYEAARAFTGWTIEDGSNTGRGTIFPKTGKFVYFDGWHDNYQKRVLGTEFDPNAAPMSDGRKVLDLVSYHPGTAVFLCTKLCRRLVSDEPPRDLIKRAVDTWESTRKSPDQIAQVLRTIILSPEFASFNAIKIKRPFEYNVSFLRATGGDVIPGEPLFNNLSGAGQRLFEWPTPTGHPDLADYWLNSNSTLSCWNMAVGHCTPNSKMAVVDLAAQTPAQIRTQAELVNYWFERLTGRAPKATTAAKLLAFLPKPQEPDFTPDIHAQNFRAPLQAMVTSIAMLPEFMVRG